MSELTIEEVKTKIIYIVATPCKVLTYFEKCDRIEAILDSFHEGLKQKIKELETEKAKLKETAPEPTV